MIFYDVYAFFFEMAPDALLHVMLSSSEMFCQ